MVNCIGLENRAFRGPWVRIPRSPHIQENELIAHFFVYRGVVWYAEDCSRQQVLSTGETPA